MSGESHTEMRKFSNITYSFLRVSWAPAILLYLHTKFQPPLLCGGVNTQAMWPLGGVSAINIVALGVQT